MPDGPRALRPDEWDQLDTLEATVFRPEMFRDYPQLFNEQNRQNLRVVAEDGKVVTHVGMTERGASLAGCGIDVCCIGAVATYEEYRGKGYASLAFQDCCDKAAADGVDVMLISGGRGLYTRVGCRQVGQDFDFTLTPDTARPLAAAGYDLVPLTADDIPYLRALHQQESVRFLRPRDDWERAFSCQNVMNTPSHFWGIVVGGGGANPKSGDPRPRLIQNPKSILAYLICHQPDRLRRRNPDDPRLVRVVEFAGDRAALLAAVPQLLEHYSAQRLSLHVQGTDAVLLANLQCLGLEGSPTGSSGTLRVINFPQLMERCRPLLEERLGTSSRALRFESDERPGSAIGRFTVRSGNEALRIPNLATLAEFLFGSPKREPVATEGSARLAALLRQALPLPTLWYGVNYV